MFLYKTNILPKVGLFLTIAFISLGCTSIPISGCSAKWKVTGFYTPLESDFKGKDQIIAVKGKSKVKLKDDFLDSVKMEGWGKTRYGWYLGYYDKSWHISKTAMNARGYPLRYGTVAVDPKVVKLGRNLVIPELEKILGLKTLLASDTGGAIKNKHIDIYMGEGKKAENLTYKITGSRTVCF